jgi:HK97 family phage major capsid protein
MVTDLRVKRREARTQLHAVLDKATADKRNMNAAEHAEFDRLEAEVRAFNDRIEELEIQISADEAAAPMAGKYAPRSNGEKMIERRTDVMPGTSRIQVTRSEEIYRPDNGTSYFRDLYFARNKNDRDAADRLARNNALRNESRAISGNVAGAGGEFVPPLWLETQFVEFARPGRVAVDLTNVEPLPAGTDSLILPKISGGTATAVQSTQNSAIQNTDMQTTSVSSPVTTIAGGQTVSLQLMEQSPLNMDQVILNDLAASYGATFNSLVLNGSGTSGQPTGILNVAGINAVDFPTPTGTPTQAQVVAAFYSKVADAIQRISTNRFLPPDAIIMSPRRWAWLVATSDSNSRPLVVPRAGGPFNAVGVQGGIAAQGYVGDMLGLPVYVDSQIPTNLAADAGTGEDAVIVARMSDLWTYESHVRAEAFEQSYASNMSVFVRLYSYVGFIGNRYPKSISVITGSGLSAPTF